ncbi:MAG: sigma-70 family RNA polymerase sigma factor [Phycisphaerae bacterium]|nr:sigma-70 family RNA polymerase sigma factor [Phycisphaerae bacterium]
MRSRLKTEFNELWVRTAANVRAYMFCACGSWTDADDMVQDCYLRALRGWGQFDGRASRQAWLFGIARMTRADWYRKKMRKSAAVSVANLDDMDSGLREGEDVNKINMVWDAIKELGAEQSEVVHLRFAAGLGYAEIARVLGVPIGTVRSRLHRGLKAIREKVKDKENEA